MYYYATEVQHVTGMCSVLNWQDNTDMIMTSQAWNVSLKYTTEKRRQDEWDN